MAQRAAAAFGAAVVSASLVLAPPPAAADMLEDLAEAAMAPSASTTRVIRLPASDDPAILRAQQTMVQAWQTVGEAFFDGSFGGANWVRAHTNSLNGLGVCAYV